MKRIGVILFALILTFAGLSQSAEAASNSAYKDAVNAGERLKGMTSQFNQYINSGELVTINANYDALSNQIKSVERAIGKVSGKTTRQGLNDKYIKPAKVARERTIYEVSQFRLLGKLETLLLAQNSSKFQSELGKLSRLKKRAIDIKKAGGYASLPSNVGATLSKWENDIVNHKNPIESNTIKKESEPNDIISNANIAQSGVIYEGLIDESSDVDWFKITTKSAGDIRITLEDLPKTYELILYDRAGNYLADSNHASNTAEYLTYNGKYAGDYFIKIVPYYEDAYNNQYTYKLKATYNSDNSNGSNDSIGNSSKLTNGRSYLETIENITDEDWYTFTSSSAGDIRIVLDNLPNTYKAYLYDKFGNYLDDSNYTSDSSEVIDYHAQEASTFFVRVIPYYGDYSKNNKYHITAHYPTANKYFYNLGEDNDVLQNAFTVNKNVPYNFKIEHVNDRDWYKIQAKEGTLRVVLDLLPKDYEFHLYDKFGNYIDESYYVSETAEALEVTITKSDAYYISVHSNGYFSDSPYRLRYFQ